MNERQKLLKLLDIALEEGYFEGDMQGFRNLLQNEGNFNDYFEFKGYFIDIFDHKFARALAARKINTEKPGYLDLDECWTDPAKHQIFKKIETDKEAMALLQQAVVSENPINTLHKQLCKS
jgi:hypothetical protein